MIYGNCNKKFCIHVNLKKVPESSTLIFKQEFAEISQINFRINPSRNHPQPGLYISNAYARSFWGNLNTHSGLFFYYGFFFFFCKPGSPNAWKQIHEQSLYLSSWILLSQFTIIFFIKYKKTVLSVYLDFPRMILHMHGWYTGLIAGGCSWVLS